MGMNEIETVGALIKKLEKFPKDYKINVNIDNAYTSYIYNIYLDKYALKNYNTKEVTIRV